MILNTSKPLCIVDNDGNKHITKIQIGNEVLGIKDIQCTITIEKLKEEIINLSNKVELLEQQIKDLY